MKTVLYLGTHPSDKEEILHYPVIRLVPRDPKQREMFSCLTSLSLFSHFLFTSKNAVAIFFAACTQLLVNPQKYLLGKSISIGPATSQALRDRGIEPLLEASITTQEGVIAEIHRYALEGAHFLYPRSSLSRPFLREYLEGQGFLVKALDLYDTEYQKLEPVPSLEHIQEIVFTSPSTVEGFFRIFTSIPEEIKLSFQGPITRRAFKEKTRL